MAQRLAIAACIRSLTRPLLDLRYESLPQLPAQRYLRRPHPTVDPQSQYETGYSHHLSPEITVNEPGECDRMANSQRPRSAIADL